MQKKSKSSSSRRTALKTIAGVGLVGVTSVGKASADNNDFQTSSSGWVEYNDDESFSQTTSVRLEYVVSEWQTRPDGSEVYSHIFNYEMVAEDYDEDNDQKSYGIEKQDFIAETDGTASFDQVPNSSKYIRSMAKPYDVGDGNYNSLVETATTELLAETPVGYILSAADIYQSYYDPGAFDTSDPTKLELTQDFAFTNWASSYFVGFQADMDTINSTSGTMTIESDTGWENIGIDVTFVPGGSVSPSSPTSPSIDELEYDDLQDMSDNELSEYGIERITTEKIRNDKIKHRVPKWKISEYRSRSDPAYVTTESTDITINKSD
ncbi:hypothetical protein [Halorubrum sp. FL23]|jgi:hypothetical protein|uniref:hypothetical protein n=1 Tax=Halorubrum sp. FL23 TaxID=3458704 RepID=UPI0040335C42